MDEILPKIVIQLIIMAYGISWRLAGGKLDCTNSIFIQTGLKMAGTLAGAELGKSSKCQQITVNSV